MLTNGTGFKLKEVAKPEGVRVLLRPYDDGCPGDEELGTMLLLLLLLLLPA